LIVDMGCMQGVMALAAALLVRTQPTVLKTHGLCCGNASCTPLQAMHGVLRDRGLYCCKYSSDDNIDF
jgi:hypothetical protein